METDHQISTTEMWAWIAWSIAIGLTVVGSVIGIVWADLPRVRMMAICILANAFLVLAGGVCLTIKVMLRHQSSYLLGVLATQADAEGRLRITR